MNNNKRLIEVDFPLEQVSLDSVHEKNVRHGHISTLHIWPARRPLAASRAALIATLLPDPGDPEERKAIMAASPVKGKYDQAVDSESAYEILQKRLSGQVATTPAGQGGAQADPNAAGGGAGEGEVRL